MTRISICYILNNFEKLLITYYYILVENKKLNENKTLDLQTIHLLHSNNHLHTPNPLISRPSRGRTERGRLAISSSSTILSDPFVHLDQR